MLSGVIFIDITTPTKTLISYARYYTSTSTIRGLGYIERTGTQSTDFNF